MKKEDIIKRSTDKFNTLDKLLQRYYNFNVYPVILSTILISMWFVWYKVVLPRLPRVIPFDLSLTSFISVCILFIWLLIKTYDYPRKPPKVEGNPSYILYRVFCTNTRFKYLVNITSKLLPYIYLNNTHYLRAYMIAYFLPSFILLCLFAIDIFYYKYLHFLYIYSFLALIPLIVEYYISVMIIVENIYVFPLEDYYSVRPPYSNYKAYFIASCRQRYSDYSSYKRHESGDSICVRRAIDDRITERVDKYEFCCIVEKSCVDKYNKMNPNTKINYDFMTQEQIDLLAKEFYYLMSVILHIIYFKRMHYYIPFTNKDKLTIDKRYQRNLLYIRKVKRYLLMLYFICWVYGFVVSSPTFHLLNFEIVFLENFKDILDPLY
jgi:hypothetical protein